MNGSRSGSLCLAGCGFSSAEQLPFPERWSKNIIWMWS